MNTDATATTWLTRDAYERLQAELAQLSGPAAEHEDEHDAAVRGLRAQRLSDVLRDARVGDVPPDDGIVEPGMVVTVAFPDRPQETLTFLMATRELEAHGMDTYSPGSPLGQAVAGHKPGDTVDYQLPNGTGGVATILAARPYSD
ncbi:GreA/GreB family elongation factor [Streptomyces sp. N35]|uniref:GreA/GreB family elongation factor n=1 Tax=Streptomyces sp. N35 TaxID=2795730 RepID=UPI0027DB5B37|nr:GreA/GreB family elongation factor [Streptomyces sp. N35]